MRILAAILIAVIVLGGTGLYIRFSESIAPPPIDMREEAADGSYSVDFTLTFDVDSNVFAGFEEYAFRARLADTVLLESNERIPAGKPLRIDNVDGIKVGRNEIWVYASPAKETVKNLSEQNAFIGFDDTNASVAPDENDNSQFAVDRAIRVRISRDGEVVAEKTLWSQDNQAVQGTIELLVAGDSTKSDQ
jgi:hypothetical protein